MERTYLMDLFKESITKNWDVAAFTDYARKNDSVKFRDVALRISELHEIFYSSGIKPGNKIAVLGKNSTNWATAYLSVILYGAITVPILPEFSSEEIQNILNHSDTVMMFCNDDIFKTLSVSKIKKVKTIFSLNSFNVLSGGKNKKTLNETSSRIKSLKNDNPIIDTGLFKRYIKHKKKPDDELVSIVYTSGTTGFSKGVMLPQRSLRANIIYGQDNMPLVSGDKILSFLPLAHSFGCAYEFLFPFTLGCHITFLDRIPSPTILLKAFSEIKPRLILSVPLIIEKLYNNNVKKILEGKMKIPLKIPLISRLVKNIIRKKLEDVFGGNFVEIIIGGASINPEVEDFLRDIKFRYTVGYGMTECGPLISYAGWNNYAQHSVGRIINFLDVKIDSPDPSHEAGEIMVKGLNVMDGYYKNKKATSQCLSEDGWLGTGDLGTIDASGNIFIRGRKKNMLLGPSGQNIYPEEVEAKLDTLPFIAESVVIQRNGKLVALVYPDMEAVKSSGIHNSGLEQKMEENRKLVNSMMSAYSSISKIEIVNEEFEKTPSKKIRRFLYT